MAVTIGLGIDIMAAIMGDIMEDTIGTITALTTGGTMVDMVVQGIMAEEPLGGDILLEEVIGVDMADSGFHRLKR